MGATVYVGKEKADTLRIVNSSGADIVANEFTVLVGKGLKACAAVANAAYGAFEDLLGKIFEIDDFVVGEDAFATAGAAVYWNPTTGEFSDTLTVGYYIVGYVYSIKDSNGIVEVLGIEPKLVPTGVADLEAVVADITELAGRPFRKTVTLTAAAAATPVAVVAAGEVTGTKKVFITDFLVSVGGATAWTDVTATVVKLQDTAASPVVAATIAKAQLTANAQLGKHSIGVTLGTPIRTGVGLTAAKGLNVVADANFAAGDDLSITVVGFIQ